MTLLFVVVGVVFVMFFGVVAFGAPYLPTLNSKIDEALDLLDLKRGQTMLELGSGDGRLLLAAAKRGIHAVGFELNPILCIVARLRTWRYRHLITIKCANYWQTTWPPADGMYLFLMEPYINKLHKKITQYHDRSHPFKIVSFAYSIPDITPVKQTKAMKLYVYE